MENKNLQRYEEQGNGCENIIDDETAVAYIIPLQKEVILEGLLNYQEPF